MFVGSVVRFARRIALIVGLGGIAVGITVGITLETSVAQAAESAAEAGAAGASATATATAEASSGKATTTASPSEGELGVVAFDSCESQTLRIELNGQGKMEKTEILAAVKSFSSYPRLVFSPARALSDIAAFHVMLPTSCQDGEQRNACAERTGWTELQLRLKPLKDLRVFCEPSKTPSSKPSSEPVESLPEKVPSASAPAGAASLVAPIVPVASLLKPGRVPASRAPASIEAQPDVVATSVATLAPAIAPVRVLNIEVVQSAHLRSASVHDLNGRSIALEEIVADPRFAMFAGLKGVRVLKETIRKSNGGLEDRKAIQLLGRNGEVFRLIADENLENVQVDPTMGVESAQLDLVSGAVHGVALHLGGEEKRVVVLTVKDKMQDEESKGI